MIFSFNLTHILMKHIQKDLYFPPFYYLYVQIVYKQEVKCCTSCCPDCKIDGKIYSQPNDIVQFNSARACSICRLLFYFIIFQPVCVVHSNNTNLAPYPTIPHPTAPQHHFFFLRQQSILWLCQLNVLVWKSYLKSHFGIWHNQAKTRANKQLIYELCPIQFFVMMEKTSFSPFSIFFKNDKDDFFPDRKQNTKAGHQKMWKYQITKKIHYIMMF